MNATQKITEAVESFFNLADNGVVWVTPGTDNHSSNFYGDERIIAMEPDDVVGCIETAFDNWEAEEFYNEDGDLISDEEKLDLCIDFILDDLQYDKPDDDEPEEEDEDGLEE